MRAEGVWKMMKRIARFLENIEKHIESKAPARLGNVVRVTEPLSERKELARHVENAGGKVYVLVHPFFYGEGSEAATTQQRINEWIAREKDAHVPMVILEEWLAVPGAFTRLRQLQPKRPVFLVPTFWMDPTPKERAGEWGFFNELGIKKAFLGGWQLEYSKSPRRINRRREQEELNKEETKRAEEKVKRVLGKNASVRPEGLHRTRDWAEAQMLHKNGCVGWAYNKLSKKFPVVLMPEFCGPEKYAKDHLKKPPEGRK